MIQIISKHLERDNLKIPIYTNLDTVCSFTGVRITEGVANKDLIKKTFTDHAYIRYPSEYTSVDVALCIEEVLAKEKDGKKVSNALRSFSFLATSQKILFLEKSVFIEKYLFNLPNEPFYLCITYSHKKHIAYKATLNISPNNFIITTDEGDVDVDIMQAKNILSIVQPWYTVTQESQGKAQESTFFTKEEIRYGNAALHKIIKYGAEKYYTENTQIEKFRNTALFNFIVNLLQKQYA